MFSWTYIRAHLEGAVKPIYLLFLLVTFLWFFGKPAVVTYLKKEVLVIENKKDTNGIPFPAITISNHQQEPRLCYKSSAKSSVDRCIEENSRSRSELIRDFLFSWEGNGSFNLADDVFTNDSTVDYSGIHYTLNLSLAMAPGNHQYHLIFPKITPLYQIFVHDPKFFMVTDNPSAFPMEYRIFNASTDRSHCYRLDLVQMEELNVPSDPCDTDPNYNFHKCVKESISEEVSFSPYFCPPSIIVLQVDCSTKWDPPSKEPCASFKQFK